MPKSTIAKKASPTVTAIKSSSAKRPLAEIAKTTPKVNGGGLDLEAILKDNPDKIARSTHNQERHKELSGKTVQQALASRMVDARDIRYDIAKGFMTLGA
jgi:hypothetical protein